MEVEGDGATGPGLGVSRAYRAGPAVELELGTTTTVSSGLDGDPLPGRTRDRIGFETDVERPQPPKECRLDEMASPGRHHCALSGADPPASDHMRPTSPRQHRLRPADGSAHR